MSHELTVPERNAALEAHTQRILAAKGRLARDFYEIGTRLAEIRHEGLWEAGGYDGYDDYLRRAVDIPASSAWRYVRIAAEFNAEIAARYGVEKLDALISWMNATPAAELPGDVFAKKIRIRGASGRFQQVPVPKARAAEIREATRLLQDAKQGGARIPVAVTRQLDKLSAALAGSSRAKGRVTARRDRQGNVVLAFNRIPLDELAAFVRAIEETLLTEG